jgi:hypothetical protein
MISNTSSNKKIARVFMVTAVALLVISAIYSTHYVKKRGRDDYKQFDSSALSGRITALYRGKSGESFMLDSSGVYYHIFSIPIPSSGGELFATIADKGDSIYKRAFSDTFKLIKSNGKVFRYKFKKMFEE